MSAESVDPQRIERVAKALSGAMSAGNREPYSLAFALEAAGLLQPPESAAELAALRKRVAERRPRPVMACEACGDLPEKWCPDCAACKAGCFGGHDGNPCTHPNARWAAPAPTEDPCRPCGCPKRFERHAWGCPTLPEDPHDSPLHQSYALGRDLPEVDPARCLDTHAFSPRDGWRLICGSCDHAKGAPCHRDGGTS
ncbi:hypothetical protein [Streptomyces sp. TRM75563]|uniref:hypothetical protein n=1 Tax=Streptomyces sp. TRM75563 TaxID=2817418 RepID=UPI001F613BDF|nr:hypothetical protein [Streptomyces sp. TRM75563]MCI4045093.1 hypothetical protein [Streptomyces sp. TRM75563]